MANDTDGMPSASGQRLPPRPARFDLARPCPKCGVGPTPSRYCAESWGSIHRWHANFIDGGHMHRKCLHCGHERIELAKDTPLLSDKARIERAREIADERREYAEQMKRLRWV